MLNKHDTELRYDAELRGKDGEHYLVYEGLAHRIEPEGSEAYRRGEYYRSTFSWAFIRQGLLGSLFFQASCLLCGYRCVIYGDEESIVPHTPQPAKIAKDLPLVAAWSIDENGLDTLVLNLIK